MPALLPKLFLLVALLLSFFTGSQARLQTSLNPVLSSQNRTELKNLISPKVVDSKTPVRQNTRLVQVLILYDLASGSLVFISEDPLQDGNNWHAAALGNPLHYTDPLGYINLRNTSLTEVRRGLELALKRAGYDGSELIAAMILQQNAAALSASGSAFLAMNPAVAAALAKFGPAIAAVVGVAGATIGTVNIINNWDRISRAVRDPCAKNNIENYAVLFESLADLGLIAGGVAATAQIAKRGIRSATKFFKKSSVKSATSIDLFKIEDDKFDYLFGKAKGKKNAEHNAPRTNQNALELKRLGLFDDTNSRNILKNHFETILQDSSNILETNTTKYGTFEVRESLFAGPSGKFARFQTTWEVMPNGTRRFTTLIPKGGQKLK